MEVRIPELEQILVNQATILRRVEELESRQLPEWISLEQACELKGVVLKTVQNQKWMGPPAEERRHVGGSREWKWPMAVVLEWLAKTDAELKSEHQTRLRVAS